MKTRRGFLGLLGAAAVAPVIVKPEQPTPVEMKEMRNETGDVVGWIELHRGVKTYAEICQEQGVCWREELRRRADELRAMGGL